MRELVGRDVAKELTFTGRVVRGEEAVALGLATRVDPDPHRAAPQHRGPQPPCHPGRETAAGPGGPGRPGDGFAAEQEEIGALIGSPNQAEAVAAEFAKRPPQFTDPS